MIKRELHRLYTSYSVSSLEEYNCICDKKLYYDFLWLQRAGESLIKMPQNMSASLEVGDEDYKFKNRKKERQKSGCVELERN